MVKLIKQKDTLFSQGTSLIEFYRENPCIAAYELLGVDLAPIQRVVFEAMWFKGYVVLVAGRGGGKCQSVDSLSHFEDKGLVYLNEELPPIPSYLNDGDDEILDWNSSIYTSKGFKPTKKLCLEKGLEGKQLTTQNGFINKGSNQHPLLTINTKGEFTYKRLDEFEIGDSVCIQRGQNSFGNNNISLDDAYLIGLFIGDGSMSAKYNSVSITTDDEYIKDFCVNYCIGNNIEYRIDLDKRTKNTISIVFKSFGWFFDKYKVDRVLSYDKSVPYSIRTSTKESQVAFLQGYFDTDGTVEKRKGGVSCCSVSKKLLIEIQLMLLNFGIISRLRERKTDSKFGKAYLLDMFSEDAKLFKDLIGFRLKRKQEILDNYFDIKILNPNKDTIPYILQICYDITKYYHNAYKTSKKPSFRIKTSNKKELTYMEFTKFLLNLKEVEDAGFNLSGINEKLLLLKEIYNTNYYFDTVILVENWKGDCYDFEMVMGDDNIEPNYFSNGFINHNTFLSGLLASLLCLLYPGYRVGLISASFRQCLLNHKDNLHVFFTPEGMKTTTQDFYNSIEVNNTEVQSLKKQNIILNKWENEERDGIIITTEKGFEFGGTLDHKVQVLNKDLELDYKELQDLIKDDYLVIKKGFNLFGNNTTLPAFESDLHWAANDCKIPKHLTLELSYFLGLLIGDGNISMKNGSYRVSLTSNDIELLDIFKSTVEKYFGLTHYNTKKVNNTLTITYNNKKMCDFLLLCGCTNTNALDKKFPSIISTASKTCVSAFLSGLYDTDGDCYIQRNVSGIVGFSTSSLRLAREVQAQLLNLGVMSTFGISNKACKKKLLGRDKYSICSDGYKIRITNIVDLTKFNDIIGFGLIRKRDILYNYLSTVINSKITCDRLPLTSKHCLILAKECRTKLSYGNEDIKFLGSLINNLNHNKSSEVTVLRITKLLEVCDKYGIKTVSYIKLINLLNLNISCVKPKEFKYITAPSIDIEVENEHCYFASGFIHHNSKMIFSEVEKLYNNSSIFREATAKSPVHGSDSYSLKFKSMAGHNGSFIEALPIGADGAKIRGSRFYCLLIDEFAQVPQKIIETVLAPMSITKLDPMKKVRELEKRKALIEAGLATDDDFEEDSINKMIATSSGFYKFNHMYKRMREYWNLIDLGSKEHAVFQVPYTLLPEGFLDESNVENARRVMSNHEFRMEYMAEMVSDSEGFFKASVLEACTLGSGFKIEYRGTSSSQYLLGVDPNQGGKAKCGAVLIKLGSDFNRIIRVFELDGKTTQSITTSIQDLCDQYNVIRVLIDRGGGGKAVCDLLEEGYGDREPMLDRIPENKSKKGRHIIELITFNTAWISDANFATLALFEDKLLRFPESPSSASKDDKDDLEYEKVEKLKKQCLNIIVTQTSGGALHFDTPKKDQNKDLYSALILAGYGVKLVEKEDEEEELPTLNSSVGLIRGRGQHNWDSVSTNSNSKLRIPSAAILVRKD